MGANATFGSQRCNFFSIHPNDSPVVKREPQLGKLTSAAFDIASKRCSTIDYHERRSKYACCTSTQNRTASRDWDRDIEVRAFGVAIFRREVMRQNLYSGISAGHWHSETELQLPNWRGV